MFRRILIPLDGSELAERALTKAVEIGKSQGSMLFLVRVVPLVDLSGEYSPVAFVEALEKMKRSSRRYLDEKLAELCRERLKVDTALLVGDPAQRIVEAAEKNRVDLIMLSSHGRSGLARWYYGSTAEAVARHSSLPVLLFPQKG